jgi:PKD domain/K319L-like, PKD domain
MSASRRSSAVSRAVLGVAVIAAVTLLVGIGTGWASDPVAIPSISSDKADYAPGETVVLTGEGWQPGESVTIRVEDEEGMSWSREVSVAADEEGQLRDEFPLPEWFVATYRVTAAGEASGVAITSFTDGNVFVKNASGTPAGAAVTYRLERWVNESGCPATTPGSTSNFTITGSEATSVSPAGGNSIGANDKDSIRVTFISASAGFGFEKWNVVNKDPSKNAGDNGALQTTSSSFCVNVSDSSISRSYVGFVKVTATPAVAKAGADQTVDEGAAVSLDGSGSTGATSYSWSQLSGPSVSLTGASTATPSFTAPDGPATLTFRLTASNGAGGSTDDVQVSVENVAPTVTLAAGNTYSFPESTTAERSFSYTATDPAGGADLLSISIDCGSGTYVVGSDTGSSFKCLFADDSTGSSVKVTANDGDGGSASDSKAVTIQNVAPTVELTGPAEAQEGQTKTYSYTVADPGADAPAITESCGANATRTDTPAADSFECTFPDGPAASTVSVSAADGPDEGSDAIEVSVANVAPTGNAGGPYSGAWGDPISFDGSASDPAGAKDTLTYEWDFDYDDTFGADATGASPSHTYATPGEYTAALRVSDEDGDTDSVRTASVTVGKRATTLTYGGGTSVQYSDFVKLKATLLDGANGIAGKTISFTIGSQSTTAVTDADGIAETTLQITQANGSYSVATSFAGDSLYAKSSDSDSFTVKQENAGAAYTGDLFARTSSATSSTATVVLSATVKDITALSGDPAYDPDEGDIRFAKVTFVDGAGNALSGGCTNLPVGLVSTADSKVGTATCNWSANIGNQDSTAFTVGIKVEGRYIRHESTDDTVVTVSKPLGTNFITGGGYLLNQASAGQKAGGAGAKTNFGFNVKYNKSGTNLQGSINAIVRNGGRVYQIKSNSMTSLYVVTSTAPSPTKPATATFNGKASIQDITNPLDPQSVDGNATLQVKMTDKGEPGIYDTIGITVWNKAGGLWFASRWDGTRTVEQLLGGGNLVAR